MRGVFYSLLLLVSLLLPCFVLFDLIGLPTFAENMIRKKLFDRGVSFSFQNAKLGVINGMVFENVCFKKRFSRGEFQVSAKQIRVSTDCLPEVKLEDADIEVSDAFIGVDFFGPNNENIKFIADQLNFHVIIKNNELALDYFNFKILQIPFSISGKIKNLNFQALMKQEAKQENVKENIDAENPERIAGMAKILKGLQKILAQNDDKSSFNATIDLDCSPASSTFFLEGKAKVSSLNVYHLELSNLSTVFNIKAGTKTDNPFSPFSLSFDANTTSLKYGELELGQASVCASLENTCDAPEDVVIKGLKFKLEEGLCFNADTSVNLKSKDFYSTIAINGSSSKITNWILKHIADLEISFVPDRSSISMQGDLSGNIQNLQFISSTVQFCLKGFKVRNLMAELIEGQLLLKNQNLSGTNISISLGDKRNIRANFEWSIPEKALRSNLNYSGNLDCFIDPILLKTREKDLEFFSRIKFSSLPQESQLNMNIFFCKGDDGTRTFFAGADLAAANVKFDDMRFDSVFCNAIVSSDGVVIPSLKVLQNGNLASCSFIYDYYGKQSKEIPCPDKLNSNKTKSPALFFEIKSDIDGDNVLKLFFLDAKIKWLDFIEKTKTSLSGKLDFQDERKSVVIGKIQDVSVLLNKLKLEDSSASISYEDEILRIKELTASFYQGDIKLNLNYDFKEKNGQVNCEAKNTKLADIIGALTLEENSRYSGELNVSMKSNFKHDNDNMLFDGDGKFQLRDCEVFNIPIVSNLLTIIGGKIIDKEWGEINTVMADFSLKNRRIESNNITTNGKFIALHGCGSYDWGDDYCDISVSIRPLQEFLPIKLLSFVTNRFLSIIEARYKGYKKDRHWEPSTGVLR